MESLHLALLQTDLIWEDKIANLANFEKDIEAISTPVDVIVLPEMFTTGFSMEAEKLAEDSEGTTLEWMRTISKKYDTCVTGSCIIKDGPNFVNRLFWVYPNGNYDFYDKRHLFRFGEEDTVYAPGEKKLIVEWKGWKIYPLICYDLRFPVWSRNTISDPYDLLIYVANWPAARQLVWDTLLKARAMENVCYVAGVNRIGTDGRELVYHGHSQLIDAKGILLNKESDAKITVLVTLNKNWLYDFRKKFNTLLDGDNFQINL